jgi:hypothetical protein
VEFLLSPRPREKAMAAEKKRPAEQNPTDPVRIRAFALFFKRYMSVSTIVVAALPIPVTSLGLIPTFSAQSKLLSVYTPLFCFLMLGLLFHLRHQLARIMFPDFYELTRGGAMIKFIRSSLIGLLPLLLIAASVVSAFQYNQALVENTGLVRARLQTDSGQHDRMMDRIPPTSEDRYITSFGNILRYTELDEIPYSSRLMVLYLAIFMTAEAAFIIMALKEHTQDVLRLNDLDLLRRKSVKTLRITDDSVKDSRIKDGRPRANNVTTPERKESELR